MSSDYGNSEFGMYDEGMDGRPDDLGIREEFQQELCALADGELDEAASARALLMLETQPAARVFFEEIRTQIRLHRDLADPERLFAHLAMTTGTDFARPESHPDLARELDSIEYVHKLATIFYQLGKSYVLAGTEPGWTERVFEKAVSVEPTKTRGRGFVDGVLLGGRETGGRVDWTRARHMLNGRVERIAEPLEKGRRLLEEAIGVDPSHEEARLYLAFLDGHEGRTLKAAEGYRAVFDTAIDEANRGHAAVQLGRLYSREENFKRALVCFRWVTMCGLAERDPRFSFVRFNVAGVYARMGERERAIEQFRRLLDEQPDRVEEIAKNFASSTACLLPAIQRQPGFLEQLYERCPELFGAAAGAAGPQGGGR